jgi:hypothetical protein
MQFKPWEAIDCEQLVQNGNRGPTRVFIVAEELMGHTLVGIVAEECENGQRR